METARPDMPLVSIGMPVRNEEAFLRLALDSVLSQRYANLEIIISDNLSSDATEEICREYAGKDNRIRYLRQQENIGAAANFQAVFEQARGRYFMWAAGHDLWSENFVSACVDTLESDSGAVLAYGTPHWIDETGGRMEKRSGWVDTRGLNAFSRYFITFWGSMNPILALIRTDSLRRCGGFKSIIGADLVILTALSLQGGFAHQTDSHWYRREFRHESSYQDKVKRYQSSEYGQVKSGLDRILPLVRLPFNLAAAIWRSELRITKKVLLVGTMVLSLPARFVGGSVSVQ